MPTILDGIDVPRLEISAHNFPSRALLSPAPELGRPMVAAEETAAASVPTKAVMLRLTSLYILDNFDGLFEVIFGGSNEIKLVSLVFDGSQKEPFKFEVGTFPGIEENRSLPFGDAGLALYFSEPDALPRFLDWRLLVVEDDSDVRNAGKIIKQVQASDPYKKILDAVTGLVNPTWAAITAITSGVISLIGALMEQNDDDVISLYAGTYSLAFDRLGIGKHSLYHKGYSRATYEILVAE